MFAVNEIGNYLGIAYALVAAFSCGTMGMSMILNLSLLRKFRMGWNSVAMYRVWMALGWMLTIGTLLWLTLPTVTAGIEFTVYYFLYMTGLLSGSVGAIGLSLKNIRIHVELEQRFADQLDDARAAAEARGGPSDKGEEFGE